MLRMILIAVVGGAVPLAASANGAVYEPGYNSYGVVAVSAAQAHGLVVSESVELNAEQKRVTVEYTIENPAKTTRQFAMLFPVPRRDDACDKGYQFVARLNGKVLVTADATAATTRLEGEYRRLLHSECLGKRFELVLPPGTSTLQIVYPMTYRYFSGDGLGEGMSYAYHLWPAKNWVERFKRARYRFVPPADISDHCMHINGAANVKDWFNRFGCDWVERRIEFAAPGAMSIGPNHVESIAENVAAQGEFSVGVGWSFTQYGAEPCQADQDLGPCWQQGLQDLLDRRPYRGSTRRYGYEDLEVIPIVGNDHCHRITYLPQSLPYLRNDIYARKGLIFENRAMADFFKTMHWYRGTMKGVQLSEIESHNVAWLSKLEKSPDRWRDVPRCYF